MDGAAHSLSIAMSNAGRPGALLHRFTAKPKRRVVPLSDVALGIEAAESLGRVGGVGRFVLRLPSADKLSAMSTTLGAQNVCVAVDPLVDETAVQTIAAFCGGRRAYLAASVPPDGPVFVIGLAEAKDLDPTYPLPTAITPPDEIGEGKIINSDLLGHPGQGIASLANGAAGDFVGIAQMRISNDHEPWYRGDPEIVVRVRRFMQPSGVFQDLRRPLPSVNQEDQWYLLGDPNSTYLFFDDAWASTYELVVWEEDSPDSDDVVGVFIVNWRQLPFGGFTERSKRDVQIRLDRD
jgi:hypothetical protein